MRNRTFLLIPAALLILIVGGCYTKFYRPGMERAEAGGPTDQLYNRYDSTAIDTTFTEESYQGTQTETYPVRDNGWYNWGRPRGYTRWGFDFDHFSPDYYWSYYGYYDYYSVPWWSGWNTDPWWYYGQGYYRPGAPGEPPSKRPGRRGDRAGHPVSAPPPPPDGGTYSQPPANPPTAPANPPKKDEPQKRGGRKGG